MSNFISSSRSNPCLCCNNISGKCRTRQTYFTLGDGSTVDDNQLFCMSLREDTNNFKFTGETGDRLWGKFISFDLAQLLSDSWKTVKSNTNSWSIKQSKRTLKRPPVPKKPSYSHLLPISDRHQQISQLLAQLSLTPAHRRNLLKRGFSDKQIQQYGFRSVSYEQPLKNPISDRLAGVAPGGDRLTNKFTGLIVPICEAGGQYLGWQYRLDRSSSSRYLWASSEDLSSHLQEYSELPLSFCLPDGEVKSDYIALTESTGFKPQLTANQFGLISLGASGGLFASSPKLLKSYLNQASNILHTKSVLLFPDAGAVRNPQVLRQYKRTIDLVQSLGFSVAIAWWGQVSKSSPDPDEYQGEYRIISPDTFFLFGLRHSAYFPGKDERNVVRQFHKVLSTAKRTQLKQAITRFKSQYSDQFDLIKQICWQHLDPQRKQLICGVFS